MAKKHKTGSWENDGRAVLQWECAKCRKRFQTKSIAEQHERRTHGKGE